MNRFEKSGLPARLAALLREQIRLARRSDFRALESLAQQADQVVYELADNQGDEQMNEDERACLTGLYRELSLVLAGAKDTTNRQLRQLAGVRKTLDTYRLHG